MFTKVVSRTHYFGTFPLQRLQYFVFSSFQSIVAVCSLLAVASAKPHVLTPVGPGVVTAQSSQVFARTYNGFVPFAVPAPIPAPVPAPAYHFVLPAAPPAPVFYPQPVIYNPPAAIPVPVSCFLFQTLY